jgi:integrase
VKKHNEYVPLGDFDRAMRRCLKLAGLKDAHFHDTRHNAATELLNAGTPERALCQIAGWKAV